MSQQSANKPRVPKESSQAHADDGHGDMDLSLLKDSLTKTPWERMQANDDALNYAEALRGAMEKRNAKS